MTDDTRPATAEQSDDPSSSMSRRGALATLGFGGLSSLGGDWWSEREWERDWQLDVDANGHQLSNLGALGTAETSTAVTDFAGQNLSIDEDGVLNASAGGSAAFESSELVPLLSFSDDYGGTGTGLTSFNPTGMRFLVPFDRLSYANASALYVSVDAVAGGRHGNTGAVALLDAETDSPIEGTETQFTDTAGTVVSGSRGQVDFDEPAVLEVGLRADDSANPVSLGQVTVVVWGEVS